MMVPDMMTMKSAGTNDQQPSSNKANSTMQTTPLQWASEASTTKRHENRRRLQNTNIYKPQMWYFETWTRTSSKTAIMKAMLGKREREREREREIERETDSKNNHHEHHQHQRSSKAGQNIWKKHNCPLRLDVVHGAMPSQQVCFPFKSWLIPWSVPSKLRLTTPTCVSI